MKTLYTDALVIGGGLAGLRVALACKERGFDAIVLSLVPAKRSHSSAAQGGMQASLGNSVMGEGDNEDVHFHDTVKGSDWGCDQDVARMFTHVAPKAVRQSANWGVPWSRIKAGSRKAVVNAEQVTIKEPMAAHGLIHARDFGGTAKWRTCYTSDGTGHSLLYALDNEVIGAGIQVHERVEALRLIHDGERCHGAVVRDLITGELITYLARTTTIATGGWGRLWSVSTNALICEGTGAALALDAGVALGNPEAVQFHPTAIVPVGILTTEGCRGDGGLLRDVDGHRFMPDYEPEKKELASRDVVSRRMTEHMRKGKGVPSPYGDHLWLDITILGREHIEKNLREVKEICQYFLGIDPAEEWIPVRPTQHYSMGGVRTNADGESDGLKGLFAVGEAACWDMHGFNRLGGNSLAETVVAGMIVGEKVADRCEQVAMGEPAVAKAHVAAVQQEIDQLLAGDEEGVSPIALRQQMESIMMERVGIFRNGEDLDQAVAELTKLVAQSERLALTTGKRHSNPELVDALRVRKMLKVALCIAQAAQARTESRGAHAREDYPERNDRDWLKRTLVRWPEGDSAPSVGYEDLDVMAMELPPGSRGYGKDLTIPHPDTDKRQAQIRAWDEANPDADRETRQRALMPYDLPEPLRGSNARREPNARRETKAGGQA
ncbi:fumarate reductase flavoprotein subunit [Ferrimonas marina]|uniref:Fumarate reductase flavoprotein subunit n=1 Tax=Ferrimonas marina TaxID=299255 RepID=A0A1M5XCC4_9GAMM|nr:fumarate reductase flavoprotein subunit [Ferrimonas marina]SHH97218.1 fumarate reductase flavoprotein subunit [Ferrimonas marina]